MKNLTVIILFFLITTNMFTQSLEFTLDEDYYNKNLEVGSEERITWESELIESINLKYSTDGGKSWIDIVQNYPSESGYYDWKVPNTPSIFCKLKIESNIDSNLSNFSPNRKGRFFTIYGENKWDRIQSLTNKNLEKVKFIDDMNFIAWGDEVLLTTENGGQNWNIKSEFSGTGAIFVDKEYGWIVRNILDSTFILKTIDGGETWEIVKSYGCPDDDHVAPHYSVRFIDRDNGIAVLIEYIIYQGNHYSYHRTYDGGKSWKSYGGNEDKFRSENREFYNYVAPKVRFPSSPEYYKITDIETINDGTEAWFFEVFRDLSWIEGYYYKMNLLNNEWDLVYELWYKVLEKIYFHNEKIGWFSGTQYTIKDWKTNTGTSVISFSEDGGITWKLQQFGSFPHINNFFSLDGKTVWAVGDSGLIMKYENTTEQNLIKSNITLELQNDNVIKLTEASFREGQNYFIETISLEDPYKELEEEIDIIKGTRFSLDDGAIDEDLELEIRIKRLKESDNNFQNMFMFWGIEVTGEQSGVTSFEDFYMFNEGKKARICIPKSAAFLALLDSLGISEDEISFAYLKGGEYFDKGLEWEIKEGEEGTVDSLCLYLDHFSQIVGGKNILTSVEDEETKLPTKFRLEQNYPNPFNPTTTINYEIPTNVKGTVRLSIYDVLGREVKTLVNEPKSAGRYEVSFDASNLTSGVYYYQLQSGSYVETKKMVLMK